MSLLLTGVTALFVKIFVHRNKQQKAFCCAYKIPCLRRAEEWGEFVPLLFICFWVFFVTPPPPHYFTIFYHLPDSVSVPECLIQTFYPPFSVFFLLQIFLDLLFRIDDLFLLFCMWLFIQWCPLIGARLFPLS